MKNDIRLSSATFSIVVITLGLFFYFTGPIFFERVELFSIDRR